MYRTLTVATGPPRLLAFRRKLRPRDELIKGHAGLSVLGAGDASGHGRPAISSSCTFNDLISISPARSRRMTASAIASRPIAMAPMAEAATASGAMADGPSRRGPTAMTPVTDA